MDRKRRRRPLKSVYSACGRYKGDLFFFLWVDVMLAAGPVRCVARNVLEHCQMFHPGIQAPASSELSPTIGYVQLFTDGQVRVDTKKIRDGLRLQQVYFDSRFYLFTVCASKVLEESGRGGAFFFPRSEGKARLLDG
jgi:hypothetical protein